jgi:phosphoenolpyruvate phosphomutase
VVAYGDVLFHRYILDSLLSADADVVLAVDALNPNHLKRPNPRDLVVADRRFSGDQLDDTPASLRRVAHDVEPRGVCGEWMGLARFSAQGAGWLREEMDLMEAEGLLETGDVPLLLTRLAAKRPVRVKYFAGHWMDVDTLSDLAEARNFS